MNEETGVPQAETPTPIPPVQAMPEVPNPQIIQPATDPAKNLGLLGLILAFFIPIVGLIVSIVARSKSKKAGYKNGMATAGIVLSTIFTVVGLLVITSVVIVTVNAVKAPISASDSFISSLTAGNMSAAYADTSGAFKNMYTEQQFNDSLGGISKSGLKTNSVTSSNIDSSNGATTATIVYKATANDGSYTVTVHLVKEGGVWKVVRLDSQKQ